MSLYNSVIFLILWLVSSSSNLAFRYTFSLLLKCILVSRRTLFRLSTLLWFGSCNHSSLSLFLWSKKHKHFSSNQGLCCFNSHRPRLSLVEVLIFSLMFSQTLFMYSLWQVLLFETSVCYSFLTSSSFSFPILNIFPSNFCAACSHTANLFVRFATIRQWSLSQSAPLKDCTSNIQGVPGGMCQTSGECSLC